ncbi:Asp-tRNA(Asn)/Glu-tRNA(Gln) amidotransferase subunit GatC [Sulfitobacter sp. W027]|uniref:Asp-tRNA(Asn)/Glu-tRNA(Gln) amidotransferase subunit GatC n=1 Tax=Sulfitobacter sp. W027 TaxID=2867025 RepID=UPI0021A97739|nr:Asp-tRNA(Asn)/Glu-tRNA(Gln) amidotransferase subunit GatC [Sulfitobacter sp. W027]UWR34357.1 Asp-tRNA(Asn)/Glu-tRNA(Gln) amidotransferase subunit GatC [Sulfitobacter sp. W027]
MSIDENTAARVAKLARIKVEPNALPALAEEFNNILGFIEQLSEVDVEGVEPMTSVTPQRLKRREDVVTDGDQQDAVLKNAPDAREGFFAVPKVVE